MTKLTILRGISGSGKSTWARQQNAIVTSRDSIRHGMLDFTYDEWYGWPVDRRNDMEGVVTELQNASIAALLKAGKDVIVDNTNIQWKFVKQIAKIGYRYGADVEIKVFDVPLSVAQMRVAGRAAQGGMMVPFDVIEKQYNGLKANKNKTLDPVVPPKPYTGTPGKPKAFLVDIDGTLAHMRDYRGPFDWAKVGLDDADEKIVDLVSALSYSENLDKTFAYEEVIVMSGRDEVCRPETEKWLDTACIPYTHLFMRPQGDMRPDNLIKAELFDKYVRDNYDVQFVLDDRDQVVEMWRAMGLTCLQVAPGDF